MATNKQQTAPEESMEVELPEELAEGVYSNLAMIAHSNSEFVVDFIRLLPGVAKAKVKARVILTPEHAQRLLAALAENVKRYEEAYGTIGGDKQEDESFRYPIGFKGTVGEA
jgi:hypothetical protein